MTRTVQMTLDDDLVAAVDRAARKLHTSRSAFTRKALKEALRKLDVRALEQQHREGYLKHPVEENEFSDFEAEQVWAE